MPSNLSAAQSGNQRQALVELRDTLASLLDTTESQVHAQLSAQYRGVLAEIAAMDAEQAPEEMSPLDEIAARRAARNGDAADRGGATGRGKHRDSG